MAHRGEPFVDDKSGAEGRVPEHSPFLADSSDELDPKIVRKMHLFAKICGTVTVFVAVMALISWVTGIEFLRQIVSSHSEVKPNTALALATAGVALWIFRSNIREATRFWMVRCLALCTLIIATLTSAEIIFNRNLGIDDLSFRLAGSSFVAGRMAPHTALGLLFAGVAVLLLTVRHDSWNRLGQASALLTGLFSLIALFGYTFNMTALYKLGEPAFMAFPTCIGLGCLCLGSLFASVESGLFAAMASRGGGGLMLRRVLPFAMLAPWIIGWVVSRGEKWRLYGGDTDDALFALAVIAVFFVLLYWNARALNRLDFENARSRDELRRSSEQWNLTFDCMSEGLSYHDPEFNVVGANTAFRTLLSNANAEGEKCYRLIHGSDAPPDYCPMRKTLDTGQTNKAEIYEPRLKKFLQVRTDPVRDASGKVFRIVHVVEDITERKQAEEHIRHLAAIVESSEDAIYSTDFQGRIQSWNKGAEKIFGYSLAEVAGRTPQIFYVPELIGDWPVLYARIASGQTIENLEMPRLRRDGSRIHVSLSVSPMRDSQGKVVGSSVIARDITGRKRVETEIQKLNAELEQRVQQRTTELEVSNKELEAFSYSVSHDLRAPLRSLDGFSRILLEEYGDKFEGEGRDFLQRLRKASQQMGQLIDALLQLSRVSRSEMSKVPVNLSAIARQLAAELQRETPERKVEFEIAGMVTTMGDPRLLHVAMRNLLGNAWKFTSKQEQAKIEFGVVKKDGKSVFFVRDNGAGFEMAYVDKLFSAFQRLHAGSEFEGHGIGLATVQRIVRRHGGTIWAEGQPNAGATFYFTLT